MAVILRGVPLGEGLEVEGDVQTTLKLPGTEYGFYVAFSDGTLVEGSWGETRRFRFRLHTEGAGLTCIRRDGDHDVLELGWTIEWVAIASYEECAYLTRHEEPLPFLPGLFDGIGERLNEAAD